MSHPSEQELVMMLLGDEEDRGTTAHVQECAECEASLEEIRRILEATSGLEVPEPDAGFEKRVWLGLRPRLRREGLTAPGGREASRRVIDMPVARPSRVRRWAVPVSVAAMLVVAFLVGRWSGPVAMPPEDVAPGDSGRVLLVAVGDHLERSRMVLVEVLNAEDAELGDIGVQRARAESLLADNRLYRQTATLSGEAAVADVLDEIERILLEVAHAPGDSGVDLGWLQERIRARDLLFKVSVVEGQARQRATPSGVGDV